MTRLEEAVFSFLKEEGYRPRYEEGRIIFKHEGDVYLVSCKENGLEVVSLGKLISITYSEKDRLAVYQLANNVNSSYILGKCVLHEDEEPFISIEVDNAGTIRNFKANFDSYLLVMQRIERDFMAGLSEINA